MLVKFLFSNIYFMTIKGEKKKFNDLFVKIESNLSNLYKSRLRTRYVIGFRDCQ